MVIISRKRLELVLQFYYFQLLLSTLLFDRSRNISQQNKKKLVLTHAESRIKVLSNRGLDNRGTVANGQQCVDRLQ